MAVESANDRAAFVATDDFGVAVTWTRSGTPSTFSAIFSRPSVDGDGGDPSLIDRGPMLVCREADLPSGAAADDPVAVAGQPATFLCKTIRATGDGMASISLRVAA